MDSICLWLSDRPQTYPDWLKHDVNIFPDSEHNKFGSLKG